MRARDKSLFGFTLLLAPVAGIPAALEPMLVSEVGPGHGLLFNHIGLVVLVIVPEGLLQLAGDVLDDILLGLRLRRHHDGGHPVDDLLVIYWRTRGRLVEEKFPLRLWELIDDVLCHILAIRSTLIELADQEAPDLIKSLDPHNVQLEPLAVVANLPEEATAPEDRSVNLVKVILEVE